MYFLSTNKNTEQIKKQAKFIIINIFCDKKIRLDNELIHGNKFDILKQILLIAFYTQ